MNKRLFKLHRGQVLLSIGMCFMLAFASFIVSFVQYSKTAYAQTDNQATANALIAQIDSAQNELNAANENLNRAWEKHNTLVQEMETLQATIAQSDLRVAEVQERLATRAVEIYKSAPVSSFINVLLGTSSFSEFVNTLAILESMSAKDATLIQEAKEIRAEAQRSYEVYAELETAAQEELNSAATAQAEIETATLNLQAQLDQITAEVALEQANVEASTGSDSYSAEESYEAGSGSGYFFNPCPSSWESSGYGWRDFDQSFHKGTDMAANMGAPVYAAASGTVVWCANDDGWNGGAGNWIWISHGDGLATKYMHLSSADVYQGQYVEAGQYIGSVGSTGNSTGPHLHFQVELWGSAVCPYDYL